jgi:cytochrome c oxidase subunit II
MNDTTQAQRAHWTARRGFVAAAGFGLVSLYLLWASYGAAPLGFGGHDHGEADQVEESGGHSGGHGAAPAQEAKARIEAFRALAERFAEQHKLPDGSVRPARPKPVRAAPKSDAHGRSDDGHSHARPHGERGATKQEAVPAAQPEAASEEGPIDVYLMAYQFGFLPAVLRLEAGVPYRFHMMAVDVAHGATVRVGPAARVVRLRPGVLVEQELTFQRAGEHLLYCTVYCGLAHDRMQGKIVVTEGRAGS